MATFDSKMVNEAYKQGARMVTITVHVAPALALWWRIRTRLAVWLVWLACHVGGMRFEIGDKL